MCGGGGGLFKNLFRGIGSLFGLGGQKQTIVESKQTQAPIVDTANDTASLDAAQAQKKKKALASGMNANLLAGDTSSNTQQHSLLGD